jgi:moderate conductance mechanosensitive channel
MIARLRHAMACAIAALMLAALPSGRAPLAQSAAPNPGDATAAIRANHQVEDLSRLLDLAREHGQNVVVRLEPASVGAATAGGAQLETSLFAWWRAASSSFLTGLGHGIEGVLTLPQLPDSLARAWRALRNAPSTVEALARIAAVIGGAVLLGLFTRRLVAAALRRAAPSPTSFVPRLGAASLGALADIAGLVTFAIAASCLRDWLLGAPDFARFIARDLTRAGVSFSFYWIAARFLLSPRRFEDRLLPIRRPQWHYRRVLIYATFSVSIYATVTLVAEIGDTRAISGWFLICSTAVLAYKLWWFWSARHDFAALVQEGSMPGTAPSLPTRLAGALAAWVLMGVAIVNWFVGRFAAAISEGSWWGVAAGVTQVAVALLPIIAAGTDLLVAEGLGARDAEASPLRKATIAVGRALACGGVWVLGLIGLAYVWGVYLLTPETGPAQVAARALVTIGIALVTGWTLWRFASVYLAEQVPAPRVTLPGIDDDVEPPAQSRLATALPLVRSAVLGIVVGVTALLVLSTLGVDIGPLLAGFGVIGLAISFGSQALVRDIMSGIFFMADDAFRVGEYVDTGRLKGTVEKITVRSVQLRHQSGLVHTVPFGQLQAITNASRDWATVKFNIRLERGIDLEQARKIIKRVGQEMLEDGELAPEIILPLKLQGVADITDGAIVCRLKITAKPARASWVQREALKRVYAALEAGGIAFASGAVTVRSPDTGAPEPSAAAGAAATVPLRAAHLAEIPG